MISGQFCDYFGRPCPKDGCDCVADAELCDEHEWAGFGDCPKCVAEHPEAYETRESNF